MNDEVDVRPIPIAHESSLLECALEVRIDRPNAHTLVRLLRPRRMDDAAFQVDGIPTEAEDRPRARTRMRVLLR